MSLNFIVIPVNAAGVPMTLPRSKNAIKSDSFTRAKSIYNFRRRRARHLSPDLLAEPGWDILLFLFFSEGEQKPVPVSSACLASDVPPTTGLRWIGVLEKDGLVFRISDEEDRRRTFVILTPKGRAAMEAALLESL